MSADGITDRLRCQNRYCPNSAVLREQMAVFLHRAEHLP